jgi:DNA-binding transcriptional ArsR family regulator
MEPQAAALLADGLRAQVPSEWTFLMVSTAQNAAVIDWLSENSRYPKAAVRLWGHLLDALRFDTGEVLKTRAELAELLAIEPRTVSELMTELNSIHAVRRERRGNRVRFYLNAHIATHLPGQAARKAAREADGPLLTVLRGGQATASD